MKHLFQHSLIENLFRQVVSQSIEGFTERLKTLTTSAPKVYQKVLVHYVDFVIKR